MLIETLAVTGMMLIMSGALMVWHAFSAGYTLPAPFDENLLDELLARRGRSSQALKLGAALIAIGAALQPPMLLFG